MTNSLPTRPRSRPTERKKKFRSGPTANRSITRSDYAQKQPSHFSTLSGEAVASVYRGGGSLITQFLIDGKPGPPRQTILCDLDHSAIRRQRYSLPLSYSYSQGGFCESIHTGSSGSLYLRYSGNGSATTTQRVSSECILLRCNSGRPLRRRI